jgi:hypothetical protein
MARIRSVKPQLRTDLTVAEWPREVRYAWVLLWGYLDDHGRGLDDLRLLVADLFPLDRDVTERKLDNWLKKMTADSIHGAAPLCRYEVDGRHYLHAVKWQHHQKVSHPQDSRIPSCPIHEQDASRAGADSEPLPNDSGTAPEPFAPSRTPAEQGAGKRSREQGAGSRERVSGELALAGPPLTHPAAVLTLLDHTGPYVGKVRAQLARQLDQLLGEAHPPDLLDAALREWQTRDRAAPGLLPDLVQDELRRRNGAHGRPRPSTTDTAVSHSLRRAAELRAQEASA